MVIFIFRSIILL